MPADQATPVTTSPKGTEPGYVGRWLAERLGDSGSRDCEMSSIGHGRSNRTYRVSSPAGAVVPGRPPVGSVAATTHDMAREQRVLTALAGAPVPVPRVLAHCSGGEPVDPLGRDLPAEGLT
ncbi:phosphotransferase family protein [Pseudonocardia sp. Cha107L01]|uniref:phosphotransferase family protein n=1 Tax=Pseudonocardia sp. Cha107L01 TaxID=3457576 RepID=UPI00403E5C07